jgi:hypothetical protein
VQKSELYDLSNVSANLSLQSIEGFCRQHSDELGFKPSGVTGCEKKMW